MAVLWALLHAFGSSPSLPIVVLAYFVGQLANTLPLPGSVSGGIAGVLIAFGSPAALALSAVLAVPHDRRVAPAPGRPRGAAGDALDDRAVGSRGRFAGRR